ncbi:TetR/AcrR family transcriptional regulator [Beijerinckia sp. L45]|uniref:TetR/AcrR family transcriptional regulator n=1 Tax=Beijerinckia sp. L45 TaxID=1641855 RepID=UPI00131E1D1D|nr:TetR/AcrR family transcriptional regulator [Beijerinckia sp. L45]
MPRQPDPDIRARLLVAGLETMQSMGFNSCAVQDITAAAGIPKGSFYNYFATKDAFAVEVLEEYWSRLEAAHGPLLSDRGASTYERVASFFRALASEHETHGFTFGCLMGSLSLELSSNSPDVREKLTELLGRWAQPLVDCLRESRRNGELPTGTDVKALADVLIDGWEGAAMRGKVLRSALPYQRFETLVLKRLLKKPASRKQ